MPIESGKYVAPTWANDTSPYINASELQDICDSIEQLPVANGGTGATTASQALTNIGAMPLANAKSKGSANTPVYGNSAGVLTPMTQPLPVSLGGTGSSAVQSTTIDSGNLQGTLYAWGKMRILAIYTQNPITSVNIDAFISPGNRPPTNIHMVAPCTTSALQDAPIVDVAKVRISTSGGLYIDVLGSTARIVRIDAVYFTA